MYIYGMHHKASSAGNHLAGWIKQHAHNSLLRPCCKLALRSHMNWDQYQKPGSW